MLGFLRFIPFRGRKRYGGYELIEQIARGGMSRIWKARHPKTGRIVALKVLTPESVEMLDRFKTVFEAEEGLIALRLNHPNVIKTYEYGRGGRDEYYIAMEFVDGPNLEALVARGDRRVRKNRFDIVMQMGSGLRYIHREGLIHRDFCPKNVLYGHSQRAKIIDFGLTIPVSVKDRTVMVRAGTASYMAPEQVRSQAVDERTDIYAFGLSVFEILTGRRPMPATGDRSRRMQDHLNIEPLPLRQVAPELPEELEKVVEKCIAKDRNMRYKSMDGVMKDLRVALEIARSESA